MDLRNIRNFRQIEGRYSALARRGIPEGKALAFARGHEALFSHQNILSAQGSLLLGAASRIIAESGPIHATLFDNILPQLPSVANPNLRLFVSPSANLSFAEKDALVDYFNTRRPDREDFRILQISFGCANQCLFCGFDAPAKMLHMPYPMILAVAEEFIRSGSRMSLHLENDPFYYSDSAFDADFGDVFLSLLKRGIRPDIFTHGWWGGHRFGEEAARKLQEMGVEADVLSVHLLHSQIIKNLDKPAALEHQIDSFVERFRAALTSLNPRTFRLFGFNALLEENPQDVPEVLTTKFITDLFYRRIARDRMISEDRVAIRNPNREGRAANKLKEMFPFTMYRQTIDPPGENVVIRPWGEVEFVIKSKETSPFITREKILFPKRLFDGRRPGSTP